MKFLLPIFLGVPLLEIYFLIQVGGEIGAGGTILLVILTAVIGAILVRAQGIAVVLRSRAQFARGQSPAVEILEGVLLFIAGGLLLTPGFITDAAGFALLIPSVRRNLIRRWLAKYAAGSSAAESPGRVMEAEYERVD